MTVAEFNEWLALHTGRFTSVAAWFAKFPLEARGEFDVTRRSVRDGWLAALRDVELADAKEATESIFRGDCEEPKSFDNYPRVIRTIARKLRSERQSEHRQPRQFYADGERTHSCPTCGDRGYVVVYHRDTIAAMRDGKVRHPQHNPTGTAGMYTGIARCSCEAGGQAANRWLRCYEPSSMIRCATFLENADYLELQSAVATELAGTPWEG